MRRQIKKKKKKRKITWQDPSSQRCLYQSRQTWHGKRTRHCIRHCHSNKQKTQNRNEQTNESQ
jgi:hypothetical protein